MPKQLLLCLLFAALSFAAPLRPISIPTLLIELNMTFSELFPAQLNSSDFVYTYSQSEARFKGPAYDGGTIDVVGCSGMKEDCPSGGGMVRQPFASAPSPHHPLVPQQPEHAVLQRLRPLPPWHLAALPGNRFPQHATLLRAQPRRQPGLPRSQRISDPRRRRNFLCCRESLGWLHCDRGCSCAAKDQGRRYSARCRVIYSSLSISTRT